MIFHISFSLNMLNVLLPLRHLDMTFLPKLHWPKNSKYRKLLKIFSSSNLNTARKVIIPQSLQCLFSLLDDFRIVILTRLSLYVNLNFYMSCSETRACIIISQHAALIHRQITIVNTPSSTFFPQRRFSKTTISLCLLHKLKFQNSGTL